MQTTDIFGFRAPGLRRRGRDTFGRRDIGVLGTAFIAGTVVIGVHTLDSTVA